MATATAALNQFAGLVPVMPITHSARINALQLNLGDNILPAVLHSDLDSVPPVPAVLPVGPYYGLPNDCHTLPGCGRRFDLKSPNSLVRLAGPLQLLDFQRQEGYLHSQGYCFKGDSRQSFVFADQHFPIPFACTVAYREVHLSEYSTAFECAQWIDNVGTQPLPAALGFLFQLPSSPFSQPVEKNLHVTARVSHFSHPADGVFRAPLEKLYENGQPRGFTNLAITSSHFPACWRIASGEQFNRTPSIQIVWPESRLFLEFSAMGANELFATIFTGPQFVRLLLSHAIPNAHNIYALSKTTDLQIIEPKKSAYFAVQLRGGILREKQ